MGAWSKAVLGWVDVVEAPDGVDLGTLTLPPVETSRAVYRVNARDGSFIWKYSPSGDTRLVGNNGSLIPMWPVRTGTAVLDGKVYFAANVHLLTD